MDPQIAWPPLGSNDFQAYYTACQALADGLNPYLRTETLNNMLGTPTNPGATMVFNPPWLFALIYPISLLNFESATIAWMMLNLLAWFAAAYLTWGLFGTKRVRWMALIPVTISFYPALQCIVVGQISLILTLFLVGALCLMRSGHYFKAGALLSLLSVKPTPIYLVLFALVAMSVIKLNWKFLGGLLFGLLALLALSELLFPGALVLWVAQKPDFWSFYPASIITSIRIYFGSGSTLATWPIYSIPLFTSMATLAFYLIHKANLSSTHIPYLVFLSLLSSPYQWTFDHSYMLIVQCGVIAKLSSMRTREYLVKWYILVLCASQLGIIASTLILQSEHQMWWPPFISIVIWAISLKNQGPLKNLENEDRPSIYTGLIP